MGNEPLSESLTITMTPTEKGQLVRMSNEQGATMRGYIRKLIRDAARVSKRTQAKTSHSEVQQALEGMLDGGR